VSKTPQLYIRSSEALRQILSLIGDLDTVDRRKTVEAVAKATTSWDELVRLDFPIKQEQVNRSRESSAPKRR
jgi:hypothetical protein